MSESLSERSGVGADLPRISGLPANKTLVLRSFRRLGAWAFRRQWRIEMHGYDNVPATGPVILAANHIGVIDGPLVVAMTRRLTFALAKTELFEGAVGAGLRAIGQIPIARHHTDTHAIRRAVKVLQSGYCMAVFPEGVRQTGDMRRIRGGAIYLAMLTGAPIVPVALLGTREPGQSISDLPPHGATMHLVYGPPIHIDKTPWPRRKADVAERTEWVRVQLKAHVEYAQRLTGMPLPGEPGPRPALMQASTR